MSTLEHISTAHHVQFTHNVFAVDIENDLILSSTICAEFALIINSKLFKVLGKSMSNEIKICLSNYLTY